MIKNNNQRKGKPLYLGKSKARFYAGGGNFTGTGQPIESSNIGGALSAGAGVVNSVMSGGNTSKAGQVMEGLGAAASSIPGIGGIIGAGVQLLGGIFNSAFGSNINEEKVAELNAKNEEMTNYNSNATSTSALIADYKAKPTSDFDQGDIGTQGWFSSAVTDKFNELDAAKKKAASQAQNNLANTSGNLVATNTLNSLANIAAKGGNINTRSRGRQYATGGDLGKPSFEDYYSRLPKEKNDTASYNLRRAYELAPAEDLKRFSTQKNAHLNSVYEDPKTGNYEFMKSRNHPTIKKELDWYSSNKGKEFKSKYDLDTTGEYYKYTPKTFAKGGTIHSGTGVFTNGVTTIGNGNTHEMNPNEGVQIGMDQEGVPNLVEQGEVIYNDYVFSNRIQADKESLVRSNLKPKDHKYTYATIAEKLTKESSERPNDPISQAGLKDSMERLSQAQEAQKQEEEMRSNKGSRGNIYAKGTDKLNTASQRFKNLDVLGDLKAQFSNPSKDWGAPITKESLAESLKISPNKTTATKTKEAPIKGSWLRYAPAVGAGLGAISDAFGLTNKADYKEADRLMSSMERVSPKPIGNYLAPKPFDRDYAANSLRAQAASTERNILENSGGNRGMAQAGLLATGMNSQNAMGNLYRQAEEYNRADAMRTEEFNRGTNMFNSQADMQSQQFNAENYNKNLAMAAQLRTDENRASSAGRSANLTGLFEDLGNIGRQTFDANRANSDPARYDVDMKTGQQNYQAPTKAAKGGKLNKRKKGYTYGK